MEGRQISDKKNLLNLHVFGHIRVTDTLLLMIVSMMRKPGNIFREQKMFLKEIRNIFCVLNTTFVSATDV